VVTRTDAPRARVACDGAGSQRHTRHSLQSADVGCESVRELADAAHELVSTVVGWLAGWLAETDALAKTKHLAGEPGKRTYAMTTLIDLAQRPALPEITDGMRSPIAIHALNDLLRNMIDRWLPSAPTRPAGTDSLLSHCAAEVSNQFSRCSSRRWLER
jgi:hypothetical protein